MKTEQEIKLMLFQIGLLAQEGKFRRCSGEGAVMGLCQALGWVLDIPETFSDVIKESMEGRTFGDEYIDLELAKTRISAGYAKEEHDKNAELAERMSKFLKNGMEQLLKQLPPLEECDENKQE